MNLSVTFANVTHAAIYDGLMENSPNETPTLSNQTSTIPNETFIIPNQTLSIPNQTLATPNQSFDMLNETFSAINTTLNDTFYDDYPTFLMPEKPSRAVETTVEAFFVVGNVLGISSILLNIVFLFAVRFIKDRKTAYFRLIQNLAIADDLAALTFLITQNWPHGPFAYIDPYEHFVLAHGLSYVFRGLPWMFFTTYLLTLSTLTLNQYIAVCIPWRYTELISQTKVTVAICVVWFLSSLQLVIPLVIVICLHSASNPRDAMKTLYFVSKIELHVWMTFFVLTIFFNTILDLIVHIKIKELKSRRRSSVGNVYTSNIQQKQQAFITLSLLLVASIFCRLPFPVVGLVGLNVDYSMGATTVELTQAIVVFLLYVNFLADPVICIVRTKEVRQTYRNLYALCRRHHCCKRLGSTGDSARGFTLGYQMTRISMLDTTERQSRQSHKSFERSRTGVPEDLIIVDNTNIAKLISSP